MDYKELKENVLSSIREGKPLTGRDGITNKKAARGKFRKKINENEEVGMVKIQIQTHLSL